jgi:peroxiredoxin
MDGKGRGVTTRLGLAGDRLVTEAHKGAMRRAMSLHVGMKLPDAVAETEVLRPDGSPQRLGHLFGARPTLCVFLRQFGCAACGEHTREILEHLAPLEDTGLGVVLVGCGTAEHARDYADRYALRTRAVELVTDPTLALHQRIGLVRSVWGTVGPHATFNLLRAMARGNENAWGRGDFHQHGGTLLTDADRVVWVFHASSFLGDRYPVAAAVDRALSLFKKKGDAGQ